MERFDPFASEDSLKDVFSYHAPSAKQLDDYQYIRRAALIFAVTLKNHVPASADRSAALRHLRECVMTANAAIALKGKI